MVKTIKTQELIPKKTKKLILKVVKKMLRILRLNGYYDKIKSFFDIFCDNREWRAMWTEEKIKCQNICNPTSSKLWL